LPEEDKFNVDMIDGPGVDLVWNLDNFPYPLKDGQFKQIIARDVIEHLTDIVKVMEEWHRLLQVGGKLWIRTNDAEFPKQAWTDPTHKHAFTLESFDYWDDNTFLGKHYGFYSKAKFRVLSRVKKNFGIEIELCKI
jgi:predicted SAM-dependent methyltransferase